MWLFFFHLGFLLCKIGRTHYLSWKDLVKSQETNCSARYDPEKKAQASQVFEPEEGGAWHRLLRVPLGTRRDQPSQK